MMNTLLKRGFLMAMLTSFAITAFAEDAPVYDADSYPPQFDGQSGEAAAPPSHPSARVEVPQDQTSTAPIEPLSLDQRVQRLEQQSNNAMHSDLNSKVMDVQTELQSLRGQVEQLTHELQVLQNQQKKMYSDLDKRMSRKSIAPVAATDDADATDADTASTVPADTIRPKKLAMPPSAVGAKTIATSDDDTPKTADDQPQPNSAEEQQIYQSAYNLIKAKKYNQAATALESMLQKYPSGQFASNAHYWLGELYGLMGKNEQAVTEFDTVVKKYPESPKLADAQLKLGLIYAAQFKWPDAKTAFKKVISHYPGTSFARLASEQLKQIKQAGH